MKGGGGGWNAIVRDETKGEEGASKPSSSSYWPSGGIIGGGEKGNVVQNASEYKSTIVYRGFINKKPRFFKINFFFIENNSAFFKHLSQQQHGEFYDKILNSRGWGGGGARGLKAVITHFLGFRGKLRSVQFFSPFPIFFKDADGRRDNDTVVRSQRIFFKKKFCSPIFPGKAENERSDGGCWGGREGEYLWAWSDLIEKFLWKMEPRGENMDSTLLLPIFYSIFKKNYLV